MVFIVLPNKKRSLATCILIIFPFLAGVKVQLEGNSHERDDATLVCTLTDAQQTIETVSWFNGNTQVVQPLGKYLEQLSV